MKTHFMSTLEGTTPKFVLPRSFDVINICFRRWQTSDAEDSVMFCLSQDITLST